MLTIRCPACELYACHDRQGGHLAIFLYGVTTSAGALTILTASTGIYLYNIDLHNLALVHMLFSFVSLFFFFKFSPANKSSLIVGLKAAFFHSCILVN